MYNINYGTQATNNTQQQVNNDPWKGYDYPLTDEEFEKLNKNGGETFNLTLTDDEILKGSCPHRTPNNAFRLIDNHDNTFTCELCGYTFDPCSNKDVNQVADATRVIVDILQTVKLMYFKLGSIDPKVYRDYFAMIPLLEKLPKLWSFALNDMAIVQDKLRGTNGEFYNGGNGGVNTYNAFHTLVAGGVNNGMQGGFQNGYNMNQPMYNPNMYPNQQYNYNAMQGGYNPAMIQPQQNQWYANNGGNMPQQQPMQQQAPVSPQPYTPVTTQVNTAPNNGGVEVTTEAAEYSKPSIQSNTAKNKRTKNK